MIATQRGLAVGEVLGMDASLLRALDSKKKPRVATERDMEIFGKLEAM